MIPFKALVWWYCQYDLYQIIINTDKDTAVINDAICPEVIAGFTTGMKLANKIGDRICDMETDRYSYFHEIATLR